MIIDQDHYTEDEYSFTIKPSFSTLGCNIEISPQGPIISVVFNDSIRNLLGFRKTILYKRFNISPNPVDIISFDNIFIETDFAKAMIFKGKRSGIIMNFTMSVSPGYDIINRYDEGVPWYMMETKDVISSICFNLKNQNSQPASFSSQSISFGLTIKEN